MPSVARRVTKQIVLGLNVYVLILPLSLIFHLSVVLYTMTSDVISVPTLCESDSRPSRDE